MRGIKHTLVGAAVVAGVSVGAAGCGGGKGMGGIGGNILGDFAARQATGMLTGGANNQQQQAEQQQTAAAQQAAADGYGAQTPTEYQAPAMDMAGTLLEKKNPAGESMGWTFMQEGSGVGMPVDISKIESDARALAGKKVILTGRYDTQTAGEPKLIAERLAVAGQ